MSGSSFNSSSPEAVGAAAAVIVAGGTGTRVGGPVPKQYLDLLGVPVLLWSVRTFLSHPAIAKLVVVLPAADADTPPEWLSRLPLTIAAGGARRGDSVRAGLSALKAGGGVVLIHDAARPLVAHSVITRVLHSVGEAAAIAAVPITDTVKAADEGGGIVQTVDRSGLWLAQTPQGFPLRALREVHRRAVAEAVAVTDDAALFERYGIPVRVVDGAMENVKITCAADLSLVRALAMGLVGSAPHPVPAHPQQTD